MFIRNFYIFLHATYRFHLKATFNFLTRDHVSNYTYAYAYIVSRKFFRSVYLDRHPRPRLEEKGREGKVNKREIQAKLTSQRERKITLRGRRKEEPRKGLAHPPPYFLYLMDGAAAQKCRFMVDIAIL